MARCFAESEADRDGSMRLMKKIWDAVLKAERVLGETGAGLSAASKAALRVMMTDLAWNQGVVARECYQVLKNSDFDWRNSEVRDTSFGLFGRVPNTKYYQEDTFAHMAKVISRVTTNKKLGSCLDLLVQFAETCQMYHAASAAWAD